NHGWLNASHSFSFASWYNPDKIHFGALRVLNDDIVAPGLGFGTHPHDNMEIITIPQHGSVMHKDSMGHGELITTGEIQVMSAGSGITHSEVNGSRSEELKLFQIWIMPNERNVTPRYAQFRINQERMKNAFLQLVSPDPEDDGAWIHQKAWIHMADLDAGQTLEYTLKDTDNGVYAMIVEGEVQVHEQVLGKRDALGLWEIEKVPFFANTNSRLLVIEVPMNESNYA
ncbi:MAG: hypothetical protein A3D92_00215, partial [Bacteroidetes bacterium RIFCSPHIGHO2_02_FULL_44_7]